MSRTGRLAVLLAVLAVAASARTPLTSVPPLAGDLQRSLELSSTAVGLLTALPVLCMGLLAPVAARLSGRYGTDRAIAIGAVVLALGVAMRPWASAPLLFAGTLLAGAGIAIVGALLPSAIKRHFPRRPGLMTSAYMGSMLATATLAAAVAVPVADASDWRVSLGIWAVPAIIGALVWLPRVRRGAGGGAHQRTRARLPWPSRTAWLVTAYLTASSLMFYTLLAWLAPAYVERGWSESGAGLLLGAFNAGQLGAALLVPILVDRVRDRRGLYLGATALNTVALIALLTVPDLAPWVIVTVLGAGNGAAFSLGLTQLVSHAASAADSARLSGMAFLVSYLVAAAGPAGVGLLHDLTGSYTLPFALLLVAALVQAVAGARLLPGRRVGDAAVPV